LEKALSSSQEEAAKASSRNEKERRDLAQKLQSVEDRLVKVQAEVNPNKPSTFSRNSRMKNLKVTWQGKKQSQQPVKTPASSNPS
jgi:hypothetical protein